MVIKEKFVTNLPGYKNLEDLAKDICYLDKIDLSSFLLHSSKEAKKASVKDKARKKLFPLLEQVSCHLKDAYHCTNSSNPFREETDKKTKVIGYSAKTMEKLAEDIFNLSYGSVTKIFHLLQNDLCVLQTNYRNHGNTLGSVLVKHVEIHVGKAALTMEEVWLVCEKYTEEIEEKNLIKGRAQRVREQMEKEGKVVTLSKEDSQRIDEELAKGMREIKKEYRIKAAASWNYMKGKYITFFTLWRKK